MTSPEEYKVGFSVSEILYTCNSLALIKSLCSISNQIIFFLFRSSFIHYILCLHINVFFIPMFLFSVAPLSDQSQMYTTVYNAARNSLIRMQRSLQYTCSPPPHPIQRDSKTRSFISLFELGCRNLYFLPTVTSVPYINFG